jgi:hypothetical protein
VKTNFFILIFFFIKKMNALVLLADIAAMQKPLPTLKELRLIRLQKARARLAEIRAEYNIKAQPKPKKVVTPNWRHENIKKAHIARAKKYAYKKMMAQDTEEE